MFVPLAYNNNAVIVKTTTIMNTFELADTQKIDSKTDKYIYRNRENGMVVCFHLHPTKPFVFVLDHASRTATNSLIKKVFNAFFNQAMSQHDYEGGFYQAIKYLSI